MDTKELKEGYWLFSAQEREVILAGLEEGDAKVADFTRRLLLARRRTEQRARSDARTGARRRVLVGAQVPREAGQRYRQCAEGEGISLYRFVCNALEREYRRLTK